MLSKTGILWLFLAFAVGMWIPHLAPGTDRDEFFWNCIADPEPSHSIFHNLLCVPWICLPSIFILLWPRNFVIARWSIVLDGRSRIKLSLWLLMLLASAPYDCWWIQLNPMQPVLEIIAEHEVQVLRHGAEFCSVFKLWECLNYLVIPAVQCVFWSIGLFVALHALSRNRALIRKGSLKSNTSLISDNEILVSYSFLAVALFIADLALRYLWAEGCIHNGFS